MRTLQFNASTGSDAPAAVVLSPRSCRCRPSCVCRPSRRRPGVPLERERVVVDVVVRDRSGAIVRGLTAGDFEVREDNRPQQIRSFDFEE